MSELLWGGLGVIAAVAFFSLGRKMDTLFTTNLAATAVYFTLMFIAMVAWWISVEHLLR